MASLPAVIKVISFLSSAGGLCRLFHDHVQPKPIMPLALHAGSEATTSVDSFVFKRKLKD